MTATDARAWALILIALATTARISIHVATTGHAYSALAVSALLTLALILAWGRRRHLLATATGRAS